MQMLYHARFEKMLSCERRASISSALHWTFAKFQATNQNEKIDIEAKIYLKKESSAMLCTQKTKTIGGNKKLSTVSSTASDACIILPEMMEGICRSI